MILTFPVHRAAFPLFNVHFIEPSSDTNGVNVDFQAFGVSVIPEHRGCFQGVPAFAHTVRPLHRHGAVEPPAVRAVIPGLFVPFAGGPQPRFGCPGVQLTVFPKHALNLKRVVAQKVLPGFLVFLVEPAHLLGTELGHHLAEAVPGAVGPRPLPPFEQRAPDVPVRVWEVRRGAVEVGVRGAQVQQQPVLGAMDERQVSVQTRLDGGHARLHRVLHGTHPVTECEPIAVHFPVLVGVVVRGVDGRTFAVGKGAERGGFGRDVETAHFLPEQPNLYYPRIRHSTRRATSRVV